MYLNNAKKLKYKYYFLFLLVSLYCTATSSNADSLFPVDSFFEFEGVINRSSNKDANNKQETYYFIKLCKPISVGADEFSDKVESIKNIQLVLLSSVKTKYKDLLGENVKIKGKLFHKHTAHHHTKVLLEIYSDDNIKCISSTCS